MKELIQTKKMFLNEHANTLHLFPFEIELITSGVASNYDVVLHMAQKGDVAAIKAIYQLSAMSSRQRSESGIYQRLQKSSGFLESKGELLGVRPYKAVSVTFTAQVDRVSISRKEAFVFAMWASRLANSDFEIKIKYVKKSMIVSNRVI